MDRKEIVKWLESALHTSNRAQIYGIETVADQILSQFSKADLTDESERNCDWDLPEGECPICDIKPSNFRLTEDRAKEWIKNKFGCSFDASPDAKEIYNNIVDFAQSLQDNTSEVERLKEELRNANTKIMDWEHSYFKLTSLRSELEAKIQSLESQLEQEKDKAVKFAEFLRDNFKWSWINLCWKYKDPQVHKKHNQFGYTTEDLYNSKEFQEYLTTVNK